MSKLSLTTSAIVAGISLNLPTSASAYENDIESTNSVDTERNELQVSKNELGYNPKGGLLDSGLCCADCRELEDIEF